MQPAHIMPASILADLQCPVRALPPHPTDRNTTFLLVEVIKIARTAAVELVAEGVFGVAFVVYMMAFAVVAVHAQAFGLEAVVVVRERDFGDFGGGTGHGEFVDAVVVEIVVAY